MDKRIRRTRQRLQDALIKLTLQSGYEKITIRDLVAEAEVGYATFFRHYENKQALLFGVVDTLIADLTQRMNPLLAEGLLEDFERSGTLLFQFIAQEYDLCRVLIDSASASGLWRHVEATGVAQVLTLNQPNSSATVPPEVAASHMVRAIIHLIQWWVNNDMPYPPEKMGVIYADLILRPTLEIAFEQNGS